MAKKPTKKMLAYTLKDVVNAGAEGLHIPMDTAKEWYEAGYVDVDGNQINEYDCILCIAMPEGIAKCEESKTESNEGNMTQATEFVIETGIPLPSSRAGRTTGSKYPFDQMEVGTSFFVPGDSKALVKSIGSAVSAANRRYSVGTGEYKITKAGASKEIRSQERKYTVRTVEGGVRVFRVEV